MCVRSPFKATMVESVPFTELTFTLIQHTVLQSLSPTGILVQLKGNETTQYLFINDI